ncbi:MAG TPA: serine/threonine-protein kinase [Vicinamibacterales bacterium]|nr:serine/threonine-protein kinase [Vicinamibacterales bacterium]
MTQERITTLKIGDIVAGYRIDGVLGSGGMGQVYLARDTQLHRTVAIKLVNPGRQRPQDLVREARLAASLDHPAICTIHRVDYLGEEPFLVMEHVKGRALSKVIRGRRSVSVTTALDFARQIVAAVGHAHGRGVIHGDLKSSNIMVGRDGRITILDFGLAVRRDGAVAGEDMDTTHRSPSSGAAGTVPYMAPEIIRGCQPTVQSDIWALGVLLFEMVAGRRPFAGNTPYELAANILANERTRMESLIQGPIRAVVDRCLCVDPGDRYQSARQLAAALRPLRRRRGDGAVENHDGLSV